MDGWMIRGWAVKRGRTGNLNRETEGWLGRAVKQDGEEETDGNEVGD